MELRELGYFIAVYEEHSVTRAARRCFISQPSVSAALASLEAELGAALFVRHRKGATPTSAGEQLYPVARRLVAEAAAIKAALRRPAPAAPVTLGLMRSLDAARVRDLLAAATRDREIALRVVDAEQTCDVRVVSRQLAGRDAFTPLWSEPYVVALPPAHPLALRTTLRVRDLAGARVVRRCHCEHARRFARGVATLEEAAAARSEEWALALVAAGVGIAFVPEGVAHGAPGVTTRPLGDVRVVREVGIAHRRRTALAPAVVRLIDDVRQRFRGP